MLVTEQKISKTSLLEGLKMGVHDIRSPITFLKAIQTTATNLSTKEKNLLEAATDRIIRIVDSMAKLLYCNSENYSEVSKVEVINLSLVIERVLFEKQYEYKNMNIKFSYVAPVYADDCLVHSRIDDLERMLSNLLNNAVEASEENCTINISIELKNKMLYLRIVDNGKGIPVEILQKLRNGITITFGKKSGQGMGFQQIKQAVTKLGGRLTINSVFGTGSEIQIILPTIM
ncbi:MAG: hypothetical protein K0R49_564 [Burkholderiales bacterium]|jgi:signal transduction histidine kinase|nr:hypothetical protein [Burkholderiales bacterium]